MSNYQTTGELLILQHYTYLYSALSILDEGYFRPCYDSPLAGDSGLNCFISDRPKNLRQEISSKEARIDFVWTGPVEENGLKLNLPYPKDVLIYQGNWRSVVPFGSSCHLRLAGILAEDDVWKSTWSKNSRWPWLFPRIRIDDFRQSINLACSKRPSIVVGRVND